MTVALDRIRYCVQKLADPATGQTERLACWRILIRVAQDEHESELQKFDSANVVKADPCFEAPF